MRKYSTKGLEKRRAERECLPEFFEKHVNIIKNNKLCCAECGDKLLGDVSEVAHRLQKSYFKSIMCDDENVNYLCSWKSINNCHSLYDGSNEQLQNLRIFSSEKEVVIKLLEKITEKINYKFYERWKID